MQAPTELLMHVSPFGWEHINLTGECKWRKRLAQDFASSRKRPLLPRGFFSNLDFCNLDLARTLADFGDVVAVLHPHEGVHRHAECFLDPQRHLRR